MKGLVWTACAAMVIGLISCTGNRYEVDTSEVAYDPSFLRLDRAIFDKSASISPNEVEELNEEFGNFFRIYTREIMQMPPPDNPMLPEFLNRFTKDPVWQKLDRLIDEKYPDLDLPAQKIGSALKQYAVHFDLDTLPQLVAYNSGFNVGIYPSQEWLGVGLEWYIGSDNEIVKQLPPDLFPQYKRDKMQPNYLVVNAVKGWLFFNHRDMAGETLLEQMVFRGKILFLTKVLTDEDEATVLNYHERELEWCEDSEYSVWSFFLENDLVFSSDFREINKILNDGPFTPGMPAESPGGVGNWVGLKMVESFMNKNEEISPSELMKTDERRILEYYKPGR